MGWDWRCPVPRLRSSVWPAVRKDSISWVSPSNGAVPKISLSPLPRVLAECQGDGPCPVPDTGHHQAQPAHISTHLLVSELNQFLRGWRQYFRYGSRHAASPSSIATWTSAWRCCSPTAWPSRPGPRAQADHRLGQPPRSRGAGRNHRVQAHRACHPVKNVGKPVRRRTSCTECAARRFAVSPAQPGGTRREVLGSPDLPRGESPMGNRACQGRGGRLEASRAEYRKIRTIWPKLDCLKPIPNDESEHPPEMMPETGGAPCSGMIRGTGQPPGGRCPPARRVKGMSGPPTSRSIRTAKTEFGITYGARALG